MIYWIIAAICAFFVKGLCGFANTLVFTSILSFGNNNINISPVELILGYPTNLFICWKERKALDFKLCLPLSGMVIAGSLVGILFLKNADAAAIKIFFGAVIILLGIEMLLREKKSGQQPGSYKQSRVLFVIIGIVSGFLCGMYGVGALLGAYIGRGTEDSEAFKANICFIFIIENTFRIILYSIYGIITLEALRTAIVLLPFMAIGLAAGMLGARVIDEAAVKKIVIVMLIISGAALIAGNLT